MTSREEVVKSDHLRHPYLLAGFCIINIIAPYIAGAIILTNKKTLEKWGWLDGPKPVEETEIKIDLGKNHDNDSSS